VNLDPHHLSASAVVDLMPNRFVPGEAKLDERRERLIARRDQVLGASYRLHYSNPVHFTRGEGMFLFDPDGVPFLDFYNNVPSLGHCHPEVVAAMAAQAATLNVNTRYLDDVLVDYAARLVATFAPEIDRVVFTCTGSESNDLALRIARFATGGQGIIVSSYAYHGTSAAAAEISPNLGAAVKLSPFVRLVRLPGTEGVPPERAGRFLADEVRMAIADLDRRGIRLAAFIADSIFSSDGVHIEPKGFLAPAVEAVREAGGLFIADEVQPGFARTGDYFWGFERHGVVPDLVTLGKPMGNGYPVGAVVGRHEPMDLFGRAARYSNTFAGNTVGIATARAVLDIIERERLQENARNVGAYLHDRVSALAARGFPIREVRGAGLFLGVAIGREGEEPSARRKLAQHCANGLRNERVLISLTGADEDVLKIRPPIICRREHVDMLAEALEKVLCAAGSGK